ncbi:hypothetical protein SNE40_020633 [Patella caerulea]
MIIAAIVTDSKSSVTCYGSSGLSCTQHQLSCSTLHTISITTITLGYRLGCGVNGVSSCADTTCCKEETGDCFLNMTKKYLPLKQHECLNKSTCTTPGLRQAGITCDGVLFSTYSKIIYSCIPANNPTPGLTTVFPFRTTTTASSPEILPTPDTIPKIDTRNTTILSTPDTTPNTDTPDIGGIVGGLIGALLVLVVIVLVGIFLFKRKQRKCGNTPTCVYNNKNESPNVTRSETPKTDYDYITTEDVVDHYQHATKHTDNYNHISLNTSVPSDDNYHHLGGGNSDSIKPAPDTYNHIRSFNHENPGDDIYNHLGSDPKPIITDSEYSHIGSDNHGLRDGDYQHLGVVRRPSVVTDSEYSHIGSVQKDVPDVDVGDMK